LDVPLTDITRLIAINLATGLLSPIFGPLSDRWGYRIMMLLSLAMLGIGMVAGGLWPTYGLVMLALFLAGVGKSIFDPALQAYLGRMVPYHRRGFVIGIVEFGWSGSSLIAIPLMGWLIDRVNWTAPFWVIGISSFLALAALAWLIPPEGRPAIKTGSSLHLGDIWRQLRSERAALGLLAFAFFIGIANDNFFVIYGVWLEGAFGLSLVALGVATMAIGLAELVGEGLTAAVSDRLGLQCSIFVGLIISAISYLILPELGQTLPLALIGLFIIFVSFEFAIVTTISLATEVLPGARATMMAVLMAAMSVGRVIGALVGGSLWLAGGLSLICWVSAFTTTLALVCLWWGLRLWRKPG
jgi:predicted MFS family arabinose efflux permease